jgi:hypothetical protein
VACCISACCTYPTDLRVGKRNLNEESTVERQPLQSSRQPNQTLIPPEIEPPSAGSLTDHQIIALTLAFLAAQKPTDITPVDVLVVVYLIQRRAFDHPISDSQYTISQRLGCDLRTIGRSLERLASPQVNWIARSKRQGRSDGLALIHANLPLAESERLRVTQDAKMLAGRYQMALQKAGRKRFPKGWLGQQCVSAQRILNYCAGDLTIARRMVGYAISTPMYKVAARQSLYHLLRRWKSIEASYATYLVKQQTKEDAAKSSVSNGAERGSGSDN